MLNLTVIAVGRLNAAYYKQAAAEYEKRLSRYCRLSIAEVADEKTPDGAGEALERQIKEKEGQRLLSKSRTEILSLPWPLKEKCFPAKSWPQRLTGWEWMG